MRSCALLVAVLIGLLGWSLVDSHLSAENDADVSGDFGSPIPGLDEIELASFEFGRSIFVRRFTRRDGLGPHFNASSCVSCHEDPAPGGSSQRYRDFFLAGNLEDGGGLKKLYPECTEENKHTQRTDLCLPSIVVPHYGPKGTVDSPVAAAVEHPAIPAGTDVVARRNAPPLFGVGLFRLVPDEEILSRADPEDRDGDGISGRVNRVIAEKNAIGRFGYKCQTASIEAFNRGALHNQMGITSDSTELVIGATDGLPPTRSLLDRVLDVKTAYAQVAEPRDRIIDYDDVRDPEITRSELSSLIFFQENLAAPRRGQITRSVRLGEAIFEEIGCTSCHTPTLETSIGCIHPYTDLLIHDMGPERADGVVMGDTGGSEFRTQPLWGLCQHRPFLHDGAADTLEQAILLHGGEAENARNAYAGLSDEDRLYLHSFLESL